MTLWHTHWSSPHHQELAEISLGFVTLALDSVAQACELGFATARQLMPHVEQASRAGLDRLAAAADQAS